MAHELDFSKGKAAIVYNKQEGTPWHNEGTAVDGKFTVEEAFQKGGIDFPVEKQDIITATGVPIANHQAVVRTDVNKVLGVVSRKFSVLQNVESAAFFDELVKDNKAIFETVGSLNEGQTIWFLAKLDEEPIKIIGEDIVDMYLAKS